MTDIQRIIKYLAIAFAVVLVVSIVSGILGAIGLLGGVTAWLNDRDGKGTVDAVDTFYGPFSDEITRLDMEIGAADIRILPGREFRVETDNPYITVKESDGRLILREKSHVGSLESSKLLLYIPDGKTFDRADIEVGAASLYCESLQCGRLEMSIGAGKGEFGWVSVEDVCEMEVGAGELVIGDGRFDRLDLEVGVGSAVVTAGYIQTGALDAGIGSIELTLMQDRTQYTIRCEDGIGNVWVDGRTMSGGQEGTGDERLDVSCGIGQVRINFVTK